MTNIGWATQAITPSRPAMLLGQMHVRVARDAADPLTVTAMALEGSRPQDAVVLVSCDIAGVSESLQEAVRAQIALRLPAVAPEAVIIAATHTHESIVMEDGVYPHPGRDVMTAAEGLAWIAARISETVIAAWENRAPRRIERAFGHAVVGHNRRAVYADGSALMYGPTNRPDFVWIEGGEDHSVDLLFVRDQDGQLSGVVIDIPCPAQVDEHSERFSADFWHEIRADLRQRFGQHLQILPLCGAAGDQSPHFLLYRKLEEEMRARRGFSERQEIAARVGDAVARALQGTHPPTDPTDARQLAHAFRRLTLAPRHVTRAERDWAVTQHATALKDFPANSWWPERLRTVVEAFDKGAPLAAVTAELHAVRIGSAVIITNPFELFLDYGWRIKARSPAPQTVVVQLAAGTGGYLPTARAVSGMHYSAHPAVAAVGPQGGDQLVEASLDLIAQVFP